MVDSAHWSWYNSPVARLNISLPDDLYETAKKWRGTVNLSEICARALREELGAVELDRTARGLFTILKQPTSIEHELSRRFDLKEALIIETPEDVLDLPDALGVEAAKYLDSRISDGGQIAIAGGRQMWRVVRNLSPRAARITITALGLHENDPEVLHVHPNTLTTLLWLLYSPGAVAKLVAAAPFESLWYRDLPVESRPSYFVVASCGPFREDIPFASLIGKEATRSLIDREASSDFAYVFFKKSGELLDNQACRVPPVEGIECSLLSAERLRYLSLRSDARVLVVAGGRNKLLPLRHTLDSRLCNVVVTDHNTATELLC